MADGSQIIINEQGITIKTNGKTVFKAGQHIFKGGEKVSTKPSTLPDLDNPYILQYLVKNNERQPVVNKPYFIIDEAGGIQKGVSYLSAESFFNI